MKSTATTSFIHINIEFELLGHKKHCSVWRNFWSGRLWMFFLTNFHKPHKSLRNVWCHSLNEIFKKLVFIYQYSYFWSYRCTMEITGLCAFLIILIWRSKLTMTWLEIRTIGYKWVKDVNDMMSFFWHVVHHFWCNEWSTQDIMEVFIAR
jgi:hypothetical protein